jgi:hypothetical protein
MVSADQDHQVSGLEIDLFEKANTVYGLEVLEFQQCDRNCTNMQEGKWESMMDSIICYVVKEIKLHCKHAPGIGKARLKATSHARGNKLPTQTSSAQTQAQS